MRSIYITGGAGVGIGPEERKLRVERILKELEAVASPETRLEVVSTDKGPAGMECRYDVVLAVPYIVKKIKEIADKADAIIVNCFGDPGVEAAREITDVPVIGPGSSSMALAQLLGHKFSVVTILSRLIPLIEERATEVGITKLASVRAIDIPVGELKDSQAKTVEQVVKESIRAIEDDGAHVIVLGCTGMTGLGEQVKQELAKQNYNVPVLDPIIVALKVAEALVDIKLSHSKLTYPQPPQKLRTGVIESK